MPTKVTILNAPEAKEEKKKIEFVRNAYNPSEILEKPSYYENIQLLAEKYIDGLDLFAVWQDDGSATRDFILGHFNDGVV